MQMTSFVGRGQEIAEVKQSLTKTRLVTLTGSRAVQAKLVSPYKLQLKSWIVSKMVFGFLNLLPITDPDLVPNTVASALGVHEEPGRPLITTLLDWFRERELLIILDNCEHLLDACARFTDSVLRGSRRCESWQAVARRWASRVKLPIAYHPCLHRVQKKNSTWNNFRM